MDFEFSAEQEELRASVRRFLADRAPITWVREQVANPRGTTEDVWAGLAALGVTGLLVPETAGGAGCGFVDLGVVLEELGRAAYPGPFASSAAGAASLLLACGDGHESRLAALADGTAIGTLAVYEPDARYDWLEPKVTADHDENVSGAKVFVADGAAATVVYVTAAGPDGFGVYEVETGTPGVTVQAIDTIDVTHRFATITFTNAPGSRIAAGDDAVAAVGATLDRLAVAAAVDGVGAAERALTLAVQYAKERVQFGQPIGSFQAVQHLCAVMLQTLEMARAGAYYALWALDAAPPAEAHRAATMVKAFASDGLPRVAADAIQVFGGIGFTWEHDAHLFFKRLLTLEHQLGGTAEHLEALADIVV